jgi:hypothetical protein
VIQSPAATCLKNLQVIAFNVFQDNRQNTKAKKVQVAAPSTIVEV